MEVLAFFIIGVYLPHQRCKISDFKQQVQELNDLIIKCKMSGEVIVIGDTNCHFSADEGNRFSGVTTPNAKCLLKCLKQQMMKIIDGNDIVCKGPNYTFYVEGIGSSYVDHVIGTEIVSANVISCEVLDDCILNTSDHLPICASFKIDCIANVCEPESVLKTPKVAWHKLTVNQIKSNYTDPLEEKLKILIREIEQVKPYERDTVTNGIDSMVEGLTRAIKEISEKLPQCKFNNKLKPYLNDTLERLFKSNQKAWHKWIEAGRPRGNDPIFIEYKSVKKIYHNSVKKAKYEFDVKCMNEVNEANTVDQQQFWRLV